ncbi:hypothetical protein PUN28_002066 [Cardiocondyla obscurior]|uniref:Uncharacterized protein n=1 Tax=Cardiocondyla obscurior TaxID=286306 RepID=A0AAW2GSJ4_9HYME
MRTTRTVRVKWMEVYRCSTVSVLPTIITDSVEDTRPPSCHLTSFQQPDRPLDKAKWKQSTKINGNAMKSINDDVFFSIREIEKFGIDLSIKSNISNFVTTAVAVQ